MNHLFCELEKEAFVIDVQLLEEMKLNEAPPERTNRQRIEDELFCVISDVCSVADRFDDGKVFDVLIQSMEKKERAVSLSNLFLICGSLLDYIESIVDVVNYEYEELSSTTYPSYDKLTIERNLCRIEALFSNKETYVIKTEEAELDSAGKVVKIYKNIVDLAERKSDLSGRVNELRNELNGI
jgi:hypothetical protein